jgi:hypothetical protein
MVFSRVFSLFLHRIQVLNQNAHKGCSFATCGEGKMSGGNMWNRDTPLDTGAALSGAYLVSKKGVSFSALVSAIEDLTAVAKSKIAMIRSKRSAMSISDMFDLQMSMNNLSQLSEMSTSVISSMNQSIVDMAKNVR